jgi:hypothetical protein
MKDQSNLLTPEDLQQINWGNPIDKDYYIILSICYNFDDENYEEVTVDLLFETNTDVVTNATYVAKVRAGLALWEVIRGALRKDFDYPPEYGSFTASAGHHYDTITDKAGKAYSRILAGAIVTQKFEATNIEPLGMKVYWSEGIQQGEVLPTYLVMPAAF